MRHRADTPTVLGPNESTRIYLVGKAGSCTWGPGFDVNTSPAGSYAALTRDVTFGYSIFGLSGTATMQMPMQLVEAEAEHCP